MPASLCKWCTKLTVGLLPAERNRLPRKTNFLLLHTLISKKTSKAPAAEVAASSCLRRAAALAGLGLELWG